MYVPDFSIDLPETLAVRNLLDMTGIPLSLEKEHADPIRLYYGKPPLSRDPASIRMIIPQESGERSAGKDLAGFRYRWADEQTLEFSHDCLRILGRFLTNSETMAGAAGTASNRRKVPEASITQPRLQNVLSVFEEAYKSACFKIGMPFVRKARWPANAAWALFLSHDVDQIYDREFFRILADLNHLQKLVRYRERGSATQALLRVLRSVGRPKHPRRAFERITEIEQRHGYRSTYFLLEDATFNRYGGRYRFRDPEMIDIGRYLLDAGCELGLHGAYHGFNDARAYRRNAESFAESLGFFPDGIRNHHLRYSYPQTWEAQSQAGFFYDATYGYQDSPGFKNGITLPFIVYDGRGEEDPLLTELPLNIMDTTLFRYLNLGGKDACALCESVIETAAGTGGLLSFLWHNNFFDEPEFCEWEETYQAALDMARDRRPWCATGHEIAEWWRRRAETRIVTDRISSDCWRGHMEVGGKIEDLALVVDFPGPGWKIEITDGRGRVAQGAMSAVIHFKALVDRSVVFVMMNVRKPKQRAHSP